MNEARRWAAGAFLLAACTGSPPGASGGDHDEPGGDLVSPPGSNDTLGGDATEPPGGDATPPLSATDLLFDDDAPVWHFDILLEQADLDYLNADPTREEYVPGTVLFAGESYNGVGVRYKGGFGTLNSCVGPGGELLCSKLSLKLSFNEFTPGRRFHGLRKVILHACNRDLTCLRERVAYRLFLDAGIEASRVVHATASINGGTPAVYTMVEYVDDEFVQDHFLTDYGNLYKETWPNGSSPDTYRAGLRNNEAIGDVSRMTAFSHALAQTTDATFAADADPWIDRGTMARYDAVDQIVNNWDGIWKFYCVDGGCGNHNYDIYDDPISARFVIIPWDLDSTFDVPNGDMARSWWDDGPGSCDVVPVPGFEDWGLGTRAPQCDPLMRGLMRSSWEDYRAALRKLLDGDRTRLTAVLARLDRYRAILRPLVDADPTLPDHDDWDAAVAQLRQVIIAQYAEMERLLAEP